LQELLRIFEAAKSLVAVRAQKGSEFSGRVVVVRLCPGDSPRAQRAETDSAFPVLGEERLVEMFQGDSVFAAKDLVALLLWVFVVVLADSEKPFLTGLLGLRCPVLAPLFPSVLLFAPFGVLGFFLPPRSVPAITTVLANSL
jgi:hypothetical protein